MSPRFDDPFAKLRQDYERARKTLFAAVSMACPGKHQVIQHPDGRPPWCTACRRTADGRSVASVRGRRTPRPGLEQEERDP